MKSKNVFNFNIESYNTIRDVLRYIFVYGCYTREDIIEKNISTRKFENECRRIEEFIDEEHLDRKILFRKKYLRTNYNRYKNTENYLVDSYLSKTFNGNDISLFFLVQQILYKNKEMSLYEINDFLTKQGIDWIDNNTLFRRLASMADYGIISICFREGKNFYSLSNNIFDILSDSELINLMELTNFFKSAENPCIPGYYLEKNLAKYMEWERDIKIENIHDFIYNGMHFQPVLDEEIVFKLLDFIYRSARITIQYRNKKGQTEQIETNPLVLRYDRVYGRWYLAGDSGYKKISIYRIDKILNVNETGKNFDKALYSRSVEENFQNSWYIAPLNEGKRTVTVKIIFKAESENSFDALIRKVNAEKKWGTIKKLDENSFSFVIDVTDADEMIPWIRSFGSHASVEESSEHDLYKKMRKYWEDMLLAYGDIQ